MHAETLPLRTAPPQLGKEKADEAIASMVEIMFQKILADASMAPFFQEADVTHIKRHLMAFCITAFGGPSKYSGLDLNRAHKRVRERKVRPGVVGGAS